MAPRKGSSPFFRVIDEDDVLSSQKNWYILSSKLCGINPTQYFKRSTTVSGFQEEFFLVGSGSLRLVDGSNYVPKGSSNGFEVVCSTFGLMAVLLRQKYLDESVLCKLKEVLNTGTVRGKFARPTTSCCSAACNAGHAGRATDVDVIVNDPSTKRKFEVFIDLIIDPSTKRKFKVFEIDVMDLVIDPSIKRQFEVVKFSKFKGDKRQR
ncbi:hypothetical protein OS493_015778 [Desmophyllum pertusum]|uniref:Uncharacterized protein n=1 Tax=Desmophyllum pertusum TaxID=174260 RepID=A0A9W9YCG7_9CNID|nr:hypothetical protein OS493_015778 [Desmophyllum pertusum]